MEKGGRVSFYKLEKLEREITFTISHPRVASSNPGRGDFFQVRRFLMFYLTFCIWIWNKGASQTWEIGLREEKLNYDKKVCTQTTFFLQKGRRSVCLRWEAHAKLSPFEEIFFFIILLFSEGLIHQFCCEKVVIHFFKYKTKFFNHLRHVILQS